MVFESILTHEKAADIVAESRLSHLGVHSRFGPHVTPDVFAVAGGRIWVVTSIGSVKVRSLRRRPEAGMLLRSKGRSLVLTGRAEILSMWSPNEALRLALYALPAVKALADFATRNVPTLLGYALDLCSLPSGAIPLDRVLVSVRPEAGVLLEGDEVFDSWVPEKLGSKTRLDAAPPEESRAVQLPPAVADLLEERTDAALGWSSPIGPIVLPASWDPRERTARVPLAAMRALGAPQTGPACITIDDSSARRPTKYRGVILRGTGHITKVSARSAEVDLLVERATWWKGFETGTIHAQVSQAGVEGGRAAVSS